MEKNWKEITIQDLIDKDEAVLKTGPFGTQLKAGEYVEKGTPVINVRNIGFGNIREEKLEFINQDTVDRLSTHLLKKDDIVFGRKGAVERHAFIDKKYANWFQGSDCLRLRINSDTVLPRFLSYQFLTELHKQWMMQQCSHGSTMASLNQDIVSRIPVTIPSVEEQRKIVTTLSAFDDLIENYTQRIAILEEIARLIYREWFVHYRYPGHENDRLVDSGTELGEVPDGWRVKELQEVANIQRGKSYRSKDLVEEGGKPFINLKYINRGGGFRKSGIKRFQGEYKEMQTVRKGDIVMAITDMTQAREIIARAARVPSLDSEYGVMSMDVLKIAAIKIESDFLYGQLRFSSFPDVVKNYANGANVLHLSPKKILDFDLLFPTKEIRVKFAELTSKVFNQIDTLTKQNEKLRETRDLLLPKLISGYIKM